MVRGSASGRHSYCLRCWANQCERRPQPRSRHWRGSWVDSISARWTSPPRNSLSHWPRRTGSTPRTQCIWLPPYRPEPTVFLRTTVGTFRRTWPKSRSPTFRTCRTRGSRLTHSRTRPPRPARGLAATGFGSGSADRCAWSSRAAAASHPVSIQVQRQDGDLPTDPSQGPEWRERGHDVYAISERPDLVGLPDEQVLGLGAVEARAVVTLNIADCAALHADWQARGRVHGASSSCQTQHYRKTLQ